MYRGKISYLPCEAGSIGKTTTRLGNDSTNPTQEQTNKSPQQDSGQELPADVLKPQEEHSKAASSESEERKVTVTIDLEDHN